MCLEDATFASSSADSLTDGKAGGAAPNPLDPIEVGTMNEGDLMREGEECDDVL